MTKESLAFIEFSLFGYQSHKLLRFLLYLRIEYPRFQESVVYCVRCTVLWLVGEE